MIFNRLHVFNRWVWALLLLTLPVSSSPLIARFFGGASVAPLSLLPLMVLVITFLLPSIIKKKAIPGPAIPLMIFTLLTVFSIALSGFIKIPSFRGFNPLNSSLIDLLTLAVGICFYLVAIFTLESSDSLKHSLHWLNLGGVIIILYAFVQFLVWRLSHYYPELLRDIQDLVSISGKLYDNRVTAFALEPSWLAHQLNVLYLPIWLAFTVHRSSIYQKRLLNKFTIENLLLLGGLFTLAATLSRIGWLSVGGLIVYLLIRWANFWKLKLSDKHRQNIKNVKLRWIRSSMFNIVYWLVLIVVLGLLGFAGIKLLSILDPKRMASVFALFDLQQYGILGWANRLEMAERFLYWMSAFYTFLAFPLFGVGLGNVGFFFSRNLNSFGYGSPEIMQQIIFNNSLVNAKNIWARLLAETGIVGFAGFIAWVYYQLRLSILLEQATEKSLLKAMGLAGILITICFVIEGFSLDSFGLPYYWIGFGLVMGAYRISRNATATSVDDH